MPRILYHFTSREAWDRILADGFLKTSNSWVNRRTGYPVGPDRFVVHLTSDDRGAGSVLLDRRAVRIDVDASDAQRWDPWMRANGVDEAWLRDLRGIHEDADKWFIVERVIPSSEWVRVVDMDSRDVIWP
jgi:hypothetical protein